jgi:CheY-like chemotaxis protein
MQPQYPSASNERRRVVICDYNALLLSVTGLLRMSGYEVFQAHDGRAAQELCVLLPNIDLLVLNTYGTGIDVGELCRTVRSSKHGLPILHIGSTSLEGLPTDVPTLSEQFTAESLLSTVQGLIEPALLRVDPALQPGSKGVNHPNGRRWEDTGSRSGVAWPEPSSPRAVEAIPWTGRLWHWITTGRSASQN